LASLLVNPSELLTFLPQESFKEFRKFPVKHCEDHSISPGYEGRFRIAAITPEKYDFKGKLLRKGRIKIFSTHANKYE